MKAPKPNYQIHNRPKKKMTQEQAMKRAWDENFRILAGEPQMQNMFVLGFKHGVAWAKEAK